MTVVGCGGRPRAVGPGDRGVTFGLADELADEPLAERDHLFVGFER